MIFLNAVNLNTTTMHLKEHQINSLYNSVQRARNLRTLSDKEKLAIFYRFLEGENHLTSMHPNWWMSLHCSDHVDVNRVVTSPDSLVALRTRFNGSALDDASRIACGFKAQGPKLLEERECLDLFWNGVIRMRRSVSTVTRVAATVNATVLAA